MSAQRVQKNLTVMFTDISGFTKHTETISREALMARLDQHNELLMPIVAHFDGKIVKTIGDAFLITFESPTNAVHCGLFIQHTLRKYNAEKPADEQIHIKVSINSGEVTVTDHDVFGDPVNVAAKIEKATNPDEIYFTESVFLAMNKAEVPTSFVKAFRPKGAESTEIKLYRVAMDEDDERYQRVVSNTHIDKEKVRTRVRELSSLAEKEFSRYQDTLETLVERQDKSSRRLMVAMIAGTAVLAAAVFIGFYNAGSGEGSPEESLAKDVRTYLQLQRPAAARDRIATYVQAEGADDTTAALLDEIQKHESRQFEQKSDALMSEGRAEEALDLAKKAGSLSDDNQKLAEAYALVYARTKIDEGDPERALAHLTKIFGASSPNDEVRRLRTKGKALIEAFSMLSDERRYREPLRLLGTVVDAFGENTKSTPALAAIAESLANELYRVARARGYDAASKDYEAYRKRFLHLRSWDWVESQMNMGALWHYRTKSMRTRWSHSDDYWSKWREVRDAVKEKPELAYRFGCFLFMLARVTGQGTCDGAPFWKQGLADKPDLRDRHGALGACYREELSGERARLGLDLKTDLTYLLGCFTNGLDAMRSLIGMYYYDDLRDTLVAHANSEGKDQETEQMNALAILATKGDAERIDARLAVFRAQFSTFVTSSDRLTRAHSKALFVPAMSYDDYEEFRLLIDTSLRETTNREGRFASHSKAATILQDMLDDLRAAQPDHTWRHDGK